MQFEWGSHLAAISHFFGVATQVTKQGFIDACLNTCKKAIHPDCAELNNFQVALRGIDNPLKGVV